MTHLIITQSVSQKDQHTAQFELTLSNQTPHSLEEWSLCFSITRFLKPNSSSIGTLAQLGSRCILSDLPVIAQGDSIQLCFEMESPALRLECDGILEAYLVTQTGQQPVTVHAPTLTEAYNEPSVVPSVEASALPIIPMPNEVTVTQGTLTLDNICHYQATADAALPAIIWLKQAVSQIQFEASDTNPSLVFEQLDSLTEGGYQLCITQSQVTITANDQQGFRNAIASLIQLLGSGTELTCVQIQDAPLYSYRGMMLDCCRHFHSLDTVKSVIDQLARYKYNYFHWHLTDDEGWRLEINAFPELTEIGAWRGPNEVLTSQFRHIDRKYGGYYTQQQVREVIEFADARGITVIPEIDIPGHCRAAIKSLPHLLVDNQDHSSYRSVQHYTDNVLSPALEGTYHFLDTVIEEVAALFPAPMLHIGADEVPEGVWSDSELCQKQMQTLGLNSAKELQGHLLRHVEQKLAQLGKRMLGWEEAQHGDKVSTNTVIYSWQSEQAAIECAGKGFDVVLQPGQFTYLDMAQDFDKTESGFYWANVTPLEHAYHYTPMQDIAHDNPIRDKILGVQAALWCELIDSPQKLNYMVHPRLQAIAEVSWTQPQHRQWLDFLSRLKSDLKGLDARGINYRNPWGK
ncbi:beta-N-acetylhexosaminidase [Vibrio gallicus]|uniref:beta-N-acetylhexosaminidase n=1 Tax=Vibrio gallicus TaxID=190897 RepID=UPI0021C3D092|nr:beta-N-acetylhexosaminidase [Vibrio gallicus]